MSEYAYVDGHNCQHKGIVSPAVKVPPNSLGTFLVQKVITCGQINNVCTVKAVNKAVHFRIKILYILLTAFLNDVRASPGAAIFQH